MQQVTVTKSRLKFTTWCRAVTPLALQLQQNTWLKALSKDVRVEENTPEARGKWVGGCSGAFRTPSTWGPSRPPPTLPPVSSKQLHTVPQTLLWTNLQMLVKLVKCLVTTFDWCTFICLACPPFDILTVNQIHHLDSFPLLVLRQQFFLMFC